MSVILKIKGILNKRNGQVTMSPSKKVLRKLDGSFEDEIRKGRKMLFEWRGFEDE